MRNLLETYNDRNIKNVLFYMVLGNITNQR